MHRRSVTRINAIDVNSVKLFRVGLTTQNLLRDLREEVMGNPYETAKEKRISVLGPTLKFKGELKAEEDLLIQGQIEGSIEHTSNLTIGEEGKVKADITAEYIAVEGAVKGDLSSSQSVTIHETAEIDGNIYSPTVSLLEGATFNGSIDMTGKKKAKARDVPASEDVSASEPAKPEAVAAKNRSKSQKSQKSPASAA